jgi:hypothetical protein
VITEQLGATRATARKLEVSKIWFIFIQQIFQIYGAFNLFIVNSWLNIREKHAWELIIIPYLNSDELLFLRRAFLNYDAYLRSFLSSLYCLSLNYSCTIWK